MSIETARSETAHGHTGPWVRLEREPTLVEAWRQVGHVLWVLEEVPMLWATPRPQRDHLSLRCCHSSRAVVSVPVEGRRPFSVGLRVHDGTLLLLEPGGAVLQQFSLLHRPLKEGRAWLLETAEAMAGGSARNEPFLRSRADWHPLVRGAAFGVGVELGLRALQLLWMNVDGLLRRLMVEIAPGTPVRLGSANTELAARPELGRSGTDRASFGISPGEGLHDDSYRRVESAHFFANVARDADFGEFRSLTLGRWVDGREPRAVLPLDDVTDRASASEQARAVEGFWRSACGESAAPP